MILLLLAGRSFKVLLHGIIFSRSFWPKTMDYIIIVTCFLSVPVILHWKVLYTVKPLKADIPRSGQPPYSGHWLYPRLILA